MPQNAAERPEPTVARKAAIAYAGARDHKGKVEVKPIEDFDLNRTIFQTLQSPAARYVIRHRVGKDVSWQSDASADVQAAYDRATEGLELPPVPEALASFLVQECNFDVEHADGSFLDHLYFCFEYTAKYYPAGSPLVMLLHSILGTGTNTFAMEANKIPRLEALLSPSDFLQVAAFPSLLRLLYSGEIRHELRRNVGRPIKAVSMRRVIDNEPLELTGEQFWEAMNYQLIHLVDFMPVANWSAHRSDTSYILFRQVFDLMDRADAIDAHVVLREPAEGPTFQGEVPSLGSWLTTRIPIAVSEKMSARSVQRFSEVCGHSLRYQIRWA
ncbi:MAG: hypothetical protein ACRBN8_38735 [Nannocystales bacterium]